NPGPVTPLVSMLGIPRDANIDIINKDNAGRSWERSDRFDMALDLTTGREGLDALAKAMQRWIRPMIRVEGSIQALKALRDAQFTRYVGLYADASAIGDRLWRGEDVDDATLARVVGLF